MIALALFLILVLLLLMGLLFDGWLDHRRMTKMVQTTRRPSIASAVQRMEDPETTPVVLNRRA